MTFSYDDEIAAALQWRAGSNRPAPPARGDWSSLRRDTEALMAAVAPDQLFGDVARTDFAVSRPDGSLVGLRWYSTRGPQPGSAVVYAHGGGLICGTLELYDERIARYVESSGVPFLGVDFRRAPEARGTEIAEEVFSAVVWLKQHADELGVDAERIAVMGDSGGGAPAAGAAILARDRGVTLCRQILIYPMLDDRNTVPDPYLEPLATWSYDNNYTGWSALLGHSIGGDDVSPIAAPARAGDVVGVAPAYLDVGELDIFRDETVEYARRLSASGVSVELHVHPRAPHGFEGFAPKAAVSRRALDDRKRVLLSL